MNKQWYVVYTKPKSEESAAYQLRNQGFDVYLPCYQKTRKHARRVDVIQAALFPRYLFVGMEEGKGAWYKVDSTRGVSYLLRINGNPTIVPSHIIDSLKKQEDEKGFVTVDALALFVKGQKVQITDGCFTGYTAVFEKMDDKQRAQLLLEFLNQPISIKLPVESISPTN